MEHSRRGPGERARRGRRVLLGAGRTLVALVAVAVLAGTGYVWTAYRTLAAGLATTDVLATRPGATPSAAPAASRRSYTALLVGLDSRTDAHGEPLPAELLAQLHAGDDEGDLHTDTIMLVRVPADPDAPVVTVSFPRDSYVPISDGSGMHKINSAYGRGYLAARATLQEQGVTGAELDRRSREAGRSTLVETVEAASGVGVDHYAEINLAGFVALTDTLGGIPVCLARPVDDRAYSGVDLPAGPQTVSGAMALAFVRQRHGLEGGDLDRITRQQAFLAGLAHRVISTGALTDPATVAGLLGVITTYVVLDSGWDLDQVVGQLGHLAGADVVFRTIPTVRPDYRTPADGVAVQIDADRVRDFVGAVLYGDARASDAPATPVPDPTQVRASGATPTTPPPTSPAAPAGSAGPEPASVRPVIDAAGVPCVS